MTRNNEFDQRGINQRLHELRGRTQSFPLDVTPETIRQDIPSPVYAWMLAVCEAFNHIDTVTSREGLTDRARSLAADLTEGLMSYEFARMIGDPLVLLTPDEVTASIDSLVAEMSYVLESLTTSATLPDDWSRVVVTSESDESDESDW